MLRAIAVFVLGLVAICQAAAQAKDAPVEHVPEPQPLPAAGVSPEEYLRRYAGSWVPEISNASDDRELKTAAQDAFLKKYAAEWHSYTFRWQRLNKALTAAPQHPSECSTLACLKAWHDAQLDRIKEYVSETWQPLAEGSLNKVYVHFKNKIEAEMQRSNSSHAEAGAKTSHTDAGANDSHTLARSVEMAASTEHFGMSPAWYINRYAGDWAPPVHNVSDSQEWWKNFVGERAAQYTHYAQDSARLVKEFGDAPATAGACHTLEELKKWRDAQLARTHAFVPKAFQGFSTKAVDDEFERNKSRIAQEEAAKAAQSVNASQVSARTAEDHSAEAPPSANVSTAPAHAAKEKAAEEAPSGNASHIPATLMAWPGHSGSGAAGSAALVLAGSVGALALALASRTARRCVDEEETADVYVQA